MALAAIEEAAEQSRGKRIVRTTELRFALAYLWASNGAERWPFDNFWKALADENDIGRSQGVNAGLNAIRRAVELPGR